MNLYLNLTSLQKLNPSQGIKVHKTKRAGIDRRQPGQPHPPLLPGFRAGLLAKLRPSWPCSWSHLNQQLSMRWESENLKGPQRSLRSGPKVHGRKNPELRGILGPWEERGWEWDDPGGNPALPLTGYVVLDVPRFQVWNGDADTSLAGLALRIEKAYKNLDWKIKFKGKDNHSAKARRKAGNM